MKKIILSICLAFILLNANAQYNPGYKCYPYCWWPGMKMNKIQLMLNGDAIGNADSFAINYPGIKITKMTKAESNNYVFLDIVIAPTTKPGIVKIGTKNFRATEYIQFEIKQRRSGNGKTYAQGLTSRDFLYLIMPDRFSNGDLTNDRIAGMRDQSLNRDTVFNRHGGDLKGIQNHLGYLDSLGVTALWLNPVLENDMPERTEHGYAFTNHYVIDPRLGGDKAYKDLIDATHKRGMKITQDAVYNHVGSYHHTILDKPFADWVHIWPSYTNTSYKDQVLFDPYASQYEKKKMADGWFTPMMPDLNHNNPFVANFLIQHAVWTVEEYGIDGWRIDTYAYNDLEFMNRCNKALYDEYPNIFLFGETWVHGVPNQTYFVQNNYNLPYKSNLQSTTDFQTLWGITDAMNKDFGWTEGVNRLYTTLAQDFIYKDASRQVIFLDNHDMARFYSTVNENMDKYLSSISWLLTSRGIPQWYYSSELATTGTTWPNDGHVRLDFPGGWEGDKENKFTINGRNQKDQAIYQHLATLANYRKTSPALTVGKFMQYVPDDGVYVYFRYTDKQTVMVVMNTAKDEKKVDPMKYAERTAGFTRYKDVISKAEGELKQFSLGSYKTVVYELLK